MSVLERQPLALDILADLLRLARAKGADTADAMLARATSVSVTCRLGQREDINRSEGSDLGLRVMIGQRQAFVSSSDIAPAALEEMAERAVAMARLAPEDRFAGLADPAQLATEIPDLDLTDPEEPDIETLFERAREAESAALAVPKVSNSEGAGSAWSRASLALATTDGFQGSYGGTRHMLSASVIAGEGTGMERDYDYTTSRHLADLQGAAEIGRSAGERAVARLHPRKVATRQVPVVYAPRVARSLLSHLAGAISGAAVARGTSFLKDRMGQPVFASGIRVLDDPLRRRGLSSRPFDAEGVATRPLALIDDGRLTTWIMDSSAARQLGLASTGHAARSAASPPSPSPSNLYLEAGPVTPDELMADIAEGFYVTDLIGFGINGVTGDYSRGAAGFWIEQGRIAYPVSEMTIAGNLKQMFQRLAPASDLELRFGTDSPTVRIDGMTVAGT